MERRQIQVITGTICGMTTRKDPEDDYWDFDSIQVREANGDIWDLHFPPYDETDDKYLSHYFGLQNAIFNIDDIREPITILGGMHGRVTDVIEIIDPKEFMIEELNPSDYPQVYRKEDESDGSQQRSN